MKIILPIGGQGTRLRPITDDLPKSMIPLLGKPLINYILDEVLTLQPQEIIIIRGKDKKLIQRHLTQHYSIPFRFIQQEKPQGFAHAISLAQPYLAKQEPVLILVGDMIFKADWSSITKHAQVLWTKRVANPELYGIITEHQGIIQSLEEKPTNPQSNLALAGIYYFAKAQTIFTPINALLNNHQGTSETNFVQALTTLLEQGTPFHLADTPLLLDCGTLPGLLNAMKVLLDRIPTKMFTTHPLSIQQSTLGTYVDIEGATTITNSTIKNAYILNTPIIHNETLQNCILYKGQKIELPGD